MEQHPLIPFAQPENVAHLARAAAENVPQRDHLALRLGKLVDRRLRRRRAPRAPRPAASGSGHGSGGCFHVPALRNRRKRSDRPRARDRRRAVAENGIDRCSLTPRERAMFNEDAEQPRLHARAALETVDALDHGEPRVLHDLFGDRTSSATYWPARRRRARWYRSSRNAERVRRLGPRVPWSTPHRP